MSEVKHTPGPWLIAGEDKTFVYALGPSGTNSFWAQVQAAGAERVSDAEKAANARLIAAAPALLEALQAISSEFIDPLEPSGPDLELPRDWLFRVREVIAKATGSQE